MTRSKRGHIAVVIPHYTIQPGILLRALRQIFAQRDAPLVHVIVVDDESPVPASDEAAALTHEQRDAITIIRRPNGGTAKARNTGLAAVNEQAEFIALLDCDDIWQDSHLSDAMAAMALGCDFFFADNRRERANKSWFEICRFSPSDHTPIEPTRRLFSVRGDLFTTFLVKAPIAASAVVMRRTVFGSFRFQEDMGTCDDLFFWLQVARRTDRIGFCARESVLMGDSINQSLVDDWRSEKALKVVFSEAMFYIKVRAKFSLNAEQHACVRLGIRTGRERMTMTALAMLASGRRLDHRSLLRYILADKAMPLALPGILFKAMLHRVRG